MLYKPSMLKLIMHTLHPFTGHRASKLDTPAPRHPREERGERPEMARNMLGI